jgi:hypothetical protein
MQSMNIAIALKFLALCGIGVVKGREELDGIDV